MYQNYRNRGKDERISDRGKEGMLRDRQTDRQTDRIRVEKGKKGK